MKTYQDKELGFFIDIPKQWSLLMKEGSDSIIFAHGPIEVFNVIIGFRLPERLLKYTEFEFAEYAKKKRYTDLEFGRILVGGREHVWARYNMGSGAWTKKYLVVFGGIEYAITATCFDQQLFTERERIWDEIVKSFRLSEWRQTDFEVLRERRSMIAGELYAKAYDASAEGNYSEACNLLKQCLHEDPEHILAHKELAFIQKQTGDLKGALYHRQEVKRLNPSDKINRFNLSGILALVGEKEDAIREVQELLAMDPNDPSFLELKKIILNNF